MALPQRAELGASIGRFGPWEAYGQFKTANGLFAVGPICWAPKPRSGSGTCRCA